MRILISPCLLLVSVGKLLVLNSSPDLKFQQPRASIQPEQVAGVLSNALGLVGSHQLPKIALPAGGFLRQPKTNLLVVVEGTPAAAAAELGSLASFEVTAESAAETTSQLLSRMLSGQAVTAESRPASVADLLLQHHKDSVVLTLSSRPELLSALSVNSQLLKDHPEWHVYGLLLDLQKGTISAKGKNVDSVKVALEQLLKQANLEGANVFEAGFAVFDASIKVRRTHRFLVLASKQINKFRIFSPIRSQEDKAFLLEVTLLQKFLEIVRGSDLASLLGDASPDLLVFTSSSLEV